MMPGLLVSAWMVLTLAATPPAQQPLSLIDVDKAAGGWEFGNGPEFPGARGKLQTAAERFRDQPVLRLEGDFAAGGKYVQASIALPEVEVEAISFWVNVPAGSTQLPIRLIDSSDQCHQIRLKLNDRGGWQQVRLPVEEYFRKMGTPSALDIATAYEKWGGANDGKWHQPGRLLVIILGPTGPAGTKASVLLSDVLLYPSTEKRTSIAKVVRLDEMLQAGEIDWGFNLGQEFPGAQGGLDLVRNQPASGSNAMRLHADFTGGGAYVGVRKSFSHLDVQAMNVIRMKMRSETTMSYALRLVDGTGQCHQRKQIPFNADGKWHDVEIAPTEMAGGEHWGGANDGKWHDSVQLIELMLNDRSDEGKKPDLTITDIRAEVAVEARIRASAFAERFSSKGALPAGWRTAGTVRMDNTLRSDDAAQSDDAGQAGPAGSLLLKRPLEELRSDTWATSPTFHVGPGAWQVQYAWRADLHSPDNSYHGSVALKVLDHGDALLETIPVGIGFGKADWQSVSKTVDLPPAAAQARFRIELKKTYGSFWLDELSASPLNVQPVEQKIERVLLANDVVGNLFMPGDKITFRVSVEASKPLDEAERVVRYSMRDYWGALQLPPGEAVLQTAPRREKRFVYSAQLSVPPDRLAVRKYHELHVEIPQETGAPVREYCGLAVLPPARSKRCVAEQVPFTIRNWDSRIPVYFDLADRIGLRLMGVWGGWSSKAPYEPHCPGIDRCKQLGAKWITGTPAASVERQGFDEYSEEALRVGMKNFLQEFADRGMAMIAMGNEPHGTGKKVLENVRAYKAIYEAVKAFDPKIHVIGTSVEPNEEYFRAGYQNYLDSYDFHVYEHYSHVRRTIQEYRALMEKYHCVKPIHSTELGLNSQGQTRHAVALEMIKKFTVFFAEGGATVSWFTIQYPDAEGKARGQFGDSHCVFDCKYNLYNPRLDAIAYYNMVNGICDKQFVEEQHYPNGVQAYLFRDRAGDCLQVLWRDDKPVDVLVPLPGNQDVELVRLDGSLATLKTSEGGISLCVSAEPSLLLYHDPRQGLAKAMGTASLSLAAAPVAVAPGGESKFLLEGPGLNAESLRVDGPPLWKTTLLRAGDNRVECTVGAPAATPAREARIYVQLLSAGSVIGELAVPVPVALAD
ncbi:MAG: hypothetical protein JXB62_13765 [Pirellulales bacterium]|nr:hypothetical protein [Pirellulales bacterium]